MAERCDSCTYVPGTGHSPGCPTASAHGLRRIREVARTRGYSIAIHGSLRRDLDLVAVPWAVEAVGAQDLVDALCEQVPLVVREAPGVTVPSPEPKPWGRLAWSLHGVAGYEYVDLSVAPRAGEAVPVIAWAQSAATKETRP